MAEVRMIFETEEQANAVALLIESGGLEGEINEYLARVDVEPVQEMPDVIFGNSDDVDVIHEVSFG